MNVNEKEIKQAINEVASTEAGKVLLFHLKELCRWDHTYLSSENPTATQYHAAVRGVYNNIRNLVDNKYLKVIEFDLQRKAVENDGRNKRKRRASTTG